MLVLKQVDSTPTIDTNAYASGDHLGSLMTLTGVNADGAGAGTILRNVAVVDKAAQKAAIDILIFSSSPTIASTDNQALSITDAQCAAKLIAHVVIATTDYRDVGSGAALGVVRGIDLVLKPEANGTLYALAVSRGSPTYGATSDLVFKYTFES